jgi:hypothetical protein
VKVFSIHEDYRDEFSLPQYSVWADGSWYLSFQVPDGSIVRLYGGPRFRP